MSQPPRAECDTHRKAMPGAVPFTRPSAASCAQPLTLAAALSPGRHPAQGATAQHKRTCRTKIIEKYGAVDAPWGPDIVGRAWGNRGNARSRQGKLQEALRDYNTAIELCPWSVDPLLNRGAVLEQLGRCAPRSRLPERVPLCPFQSPTAPARELSGCCGTLLRLIKTARPGILPAASGATSSTCGPSLFAAFVSGHQNVVPLSRAGSAIHRAVCVLLQLAGPQGVLQRVCLSKALLRVGVCRCGAACPAGSHHPHSPRGSPWYTSLRHTAPRTRSPCHDPPSHPCSFKEAEDDYLSIIAVAPDDPAAWNNLGNTNLGMGNYDAAAQYFGRAAGMAPAFSFAAANRCVALFAAGRTNESMREMRAVLRRYPDFPDTRAALTAALWSIGKEAEAESNWCAPPPSRAPLLVGAHACSRTPPAVWDPPLPKLGRVPAKTGTAAVIIQT